jgi:hypothetical protein
VNNKTESYLQRLILKKPEIEISQGRKLVFQVSVLVLILFHVLLANFVAVFLVNDDASF